MSHSHALVTSLVLFLSTLSAAHAADTASIRKIDLALAAIGESAENSPARFVHGVVTGHTWLQEQTGDLAGNWSRLAQRAEIHLDLANRRGDVALSDTLPVMENSPFNAWAIRIDADYAARRGAAPNGETRYTPAPAQLRRNAALYFDLFPAALLRQARAAPDATVDRAGRVVFTRGAERVALQFSSESHALRAFEITGAYPFDVMLAPWGEVTLRGEYAFWWRDRSGVSLPRQMSVSLNGRPLSIFELSSFTLAAQSDADFTLPESARVSPILAHPLAFASQRQTITPTVHFYSGPWSIAVVERARDLIVLEAPISPGYTDAFRRQLERDFPGKPIVAVFTTSNAWPHTGGVAPYAASRVPIYGVEANRDLIAAFVTRAGVRRNTFQPVTDGFRLGRSITARFSRGPELRNMVFLVVEGANVVWASDAIQLEADGAIAAHARQYVAELLAAVCGDIRPDTQFLAMHAGPVTASALARQFAQEPNPPCAAAL